MGMDFMKAAGVRLSVHEGKVSLPEEEYVPLAQPGSMYVRKPFEKSIQVRKRYTVPKHGSIIIPINYEGVNPSAVDLWVKRDKRW